MRIVGAALTLVVSLAIAGTLAAAERKAPEGKGPEGKGQRGPAAMAIFAAVEKLNLSADQQAKMEELKKEYGPKMMEAGKKMQGITTPEQFKAQMEAMKAARDAGKSDEEARAAGREAMKLTDEQKAKLAEAQKEMMPLQKELRDKVMALLTPEQKEQAQKAMGGGGRKPAEKK
jgi:Spy/CpxP family protein refolding chaperone